MELAQFTGFTSLNAIVIVKKKLVRYMLNDILKK